MKISNRFEWEESIEDQQRKITVIASHGLTIACVEWYSFDWECRCRSSIPLRIARIERFEDFEIDRHWHCSPDPLQKKKTMIVDRFSRFLPETIVTGGLITVRRMSLQNSSNSSRRSRWPKWVRWKIGDLNNSITRQPDQHGNTYLNKWKRCFDVEPREWSATTMFNNATRRTIFI